MTPKELDKFNPLTAKNIDEAISWYEKTIAEVKISDDCIGVELLTFVKRNNTNPIGPYQKITFFEAANRIMSDLVILHGVKWLLDQYSTEIPQFHVEYGNANKNSFDIMGPTTEAPLLVGEAFNVAPSFFKGKRSRMLKKLRDDSCTAPTRFILVNTDAVDENYTEDLIPNEYTLLVDIENGNCRLAEKK